MEARVENGVQNNQEVLSINLVEKAFWEAIDLGRSGVRMLGKKDNIYRVFESSFMEIEKDIPTRHDGDPLDDFTIIKAPRQSIVGRRFVKGKSMLHYHSVTKVADSTALKTNQDNNYVNFAYAISTNIVKKGFSRATTDIRAGICIPSAEYFSENGKKMKNDLSGVYEIQFNITGEKVMFKIDPTKLAIMPEGVVAYYPILKSKDKAKAKQSIVVVVDVGHGSTDITIARNGQPIGNSSRSFAIGGVTIEGNVARFLEENSYGASKGNMVSAIQNGWIQNGLEIVDVAPLVAKAKDMFADTLHESVLEVLRTAGLQPNEISYFYFVGRAFLPSLITGEKYDTKDLRTLFFSKWPVKSVQKLDIVSPIENEVMVKDIETLITDVQESIFSKIEVVDGEGNKKKLFEIGLNKDGDKVIKKRALTTLEGHEIIPAEVANVTGVALLLQ